MRIDEKGKIYGDLKVIKFQRKDNYRNVYWECLCSCGKKVTRLGYLLRKSKYTHCGCKTFNFEDLRNKKFGRYTVLCRVHSKDRHTWWKVKCNCGNIRITTADHLKKGNTVSCGCYSSSLKILRRGKNSPNYNFELTEEDRFLRKRNANDYHKWRKKVLKKDNGCCALCGSNESVEIHHKNSYAKYKKERLIVSNGVCICKKAHKEFHKIYGRITNSKQYEEFLHENFVSV